MKKHLGSTIALVLGILGAIAGFGQFKFDLGIAGVITILGALAYRSAKKRKLGTVKSSTLRLTLEISAIVVIVISTLLRKDLRFAIETGPVPNLLIPLWAVIAYAIILIIRVKRTTDT